MRKVRIKDAYLITDDKKYEQMTKKIDEKTNAKIVPKDNIIKNDKKIIAKQTTKQKNNILCVILTEGKGSKWLWINDGFERFSHNDNTYFKVDSGTYHKGNTRFFIYLEGVSVPFHHGHIKRETVTKKIKDRVTGKDKTVTFTKIKGLKFDSKVIDILLNRNLADEFTKQHMDLPNMAIILLLLVIIIIDLICTYASFT